MTAFSLSARPTVFQVGSAHGVVPFRALHLTAKPWRLSTLATLLTFTDQPTQPSTGNTAAVVRGHVDKRLASHRPCCGRSSVFRAYCLAGVRILACGYSPLVRLDALLGFLPLQGIAPPGPGAWRCRLPSSRGLRVPLPSRRSFKIGVLTARPALRSFTQSGGGLPTLVGRLPS